MKRFGLLSIAVVLMVSVNVVRASTPFPNITDFENDGDSYRPSSTPFSDPPTGSPPSLGSYSGYYGVSSAGWFDSRNSSRGGLFGTVASGTNGITANGGNYMGVIYSHGDGGYGYGDGPYGRPGRQDDGTANTYGGSANNGHLANWSYQMDFYLDPTTSLNSGGVPDWWWTNALMSSTTDAYATETGFNAWHTSTNVYHFTTTGGSAVGGDIAAGQWVTLEVRYDFTASRVAAIHNVWNADHTQLLGTYTITAGNMFQNPLSANVAAGGPLYSWFTYFRPTWTSTDHLTIDNIGVGVPITLQMSSHGNKGDMNNDGVVNNFDISPFEQALTDSAGYLAAYPSMTDAERIYRGDINNDSSFNNFDISPFEQLLTGGGAAPVPEPSTLFLLSLGGVGLALGRVRKLLRRSA